MSPTAFEEVTVVVVTWERRDLVLACLGSLDEQTVAHRVLVVDNASSDGTVDQLEERFPRARILRQTSNLGFAGGVSAALDAVDTRFVALLNNDAQADPRWLEASLAVLADPTVVAVTSKLLLAADTSTINNAGVVLLKSGYGADRGLGCPDDGRFASAAEVFGFSGGAVVMRTQAVKAAGGFDAGFFMYYEDTDLSWRLRLAGGRIIYSPGAVVHHLHAASSDTRSEMFAFHNERNRLLMLLRNAPLGFAVWQSLRFVLTTASLAGKQLVGRTPPEDPVFRLALRLRVMVAVLSEIPASLRKRRRTPQPHRRTEVLRDWLGVPERPYRAES